MFNEKKREPILFHKESGRPLNLNQLRIDFTMDDENDPENIIIVLKLFKVI